MSSWLWKQKILASIIVNIDRAKMRILMYLEVKRANYWKFKAWFFFSCEEPPPTVRGMRDFIGEIRGENGWTWAFEIQKLERWVVHSRFFLDCHCRLPHLVCCCVAGILLGLKLLLKGGRRVRAFRKEKRKKKW